MTEADPTSRTVLSGGLVWTSGWTTPRAADVVLDGEVIAGVFPRGSVSADTVIDLDGRLLVPGFQDAHVHPYAGGLALLTCDVAGRGLTELRDILAHYAAREPSRSWLHAEGWSKSRHPDAHRRQLDDVAEGRPVTIRSSDCHSLWANSRALAAAGIDARTPDPVNGRIHRDESGQPTGVLDEEAVALVARVIPADATPSRRDAILAGERMLLSMGITSWQDAIVGEGLGLPDCLDAYVELLHSGALSSRVTTALWWDAARGLEQIDDLQRRRTLLESAAGPDRVVADTVKIMLDGVRMDYLDDDQVTELAVALDAAGFTMHFHACADRAVRRALDGVRAARRANGWSGGRHHIAHLMTVAHDDVSRFAGLGVAANVQALWSTSAPPIHLFPEPLIDAHPEHGFYPFGQLSRSGAPMCAGSDWPVSSPDPLRAAAVATTSAAGHGGALESLDTATFLEAYTAGSARVNGRGSYTGRIAEGYLADLTMLDRNVFVDGFDGAQVVTSWIGGRVAFEQESSQADDERPGGAGR